ncbi:antitermination regulator [Mycobacterium sp. DL592]|uniref:antitermination regulator n=1 Tax=Mycobacterium sp. DL592 TaxID=2675524 RepID=UPI001423A461|nr:antitermination regulator [Mycobacterium sp. DL592]
MTVLQDFRMRQINGDYNQTRQQAEGVLVALKRCTLDAAAGEITRASRRHHLDSNRVARALVRLAQNIEPEVDSNATAVARYEWGALLPHRK